MKEISLTHGFTAKVDDSDFEFLNQWKWWASKPRGLGTTYAIRWTSRSQPPRKRIFMHKLLLQIEGKTYGDHIDGDSLNNQKSNLRPANNSQNLANRGPTKLNRSGLKGVSWSGQRGKWVAFIGVNGKSKYIGGFVDKTEAAKAYDAAALQQFGDYAKTNAMMNLI